MKKGEAGGRGATRHGNCRPRSGGDLSHTMVRRYARVLKSWTRGRPSRSLNLPTCAANLAACASELAVIHLTKETCANLVVGPFDRADQ
jgi:hypothetical protein